MSHDTAEPPPRTAAELLRTWEWVHLGYLLFVLAQPWLTPHPAPWEWPLAFAVCAITPVLWGKALHANGSPRRTWSAIVPMAVLGTLVTPVNAGASVLFVYAAAAGGAALPRHVARLWFAGLTGLDVLTTLLSQVPMPHRLWSFMPALVLIWAIGLLEIQQRDRRQQTENERLRAAQAELLAAVAERERIARDLHDLLGHSLTAVVLRAQLTRELIAVDPERARAEAEEIERNAREALAEVRATVTGWRRTSVRAELEAARRALAGTGVVLRIDPDEAPELSGPVDHALGLALREAVTNVVRHARASRCRIGVDVEGERVRLVVRDDGIGGDGGEGGGLSGLRERITALGGEVRRDGATGTTLTITVPTGVAG